MDCRLVLPYPQVLRESTPPQHSRDAVNTLWPDHYNEDANAELPLKEPVRPRSWLSRRPEAVTRHV